LRSKRFTLADAEQTNSIFVADLRFAEQKKYLRLPALVLELYQTLFYTCKVVIFQLSKPCEDHGLYIPVSSKHSIGRMKREQKLYVQLPAGQAKQKLWAKVS